MTDQPTTYNCSFCKHDFAETQVDANEPSCPTCDADLRYFTPKTKENTDMNNFRIDEQGIAWIGEQQFPEAHCVHKDIYPPMGGRSLWHYGFRLYLSADYEFSVQWGTALYCSRQHDPNVGTGISATAETALINRSNGEVWGDVKGWQSPDDVLHELRTWTYKMHSDIETIRIEGDDDDMCPWIGDQSYPDAIEVHRSVRDGQWTCGFTLPLDNRQFLSLQWGSNLDCEVKGQRVGFSTNRATTTVELAVIQPNGECRDDAVYGHQPAEVVRDVIQKLSGETPCSWCDSDAMLDGDECVYCHGSGIANWPTSSTPYVDDRKAPSSYNGWQRIGG